MSTSSVISSSPAFCCVHMRTMNNASQRTLSLCRVFEQQPQVLSTGGGLVSTQKHICLTHHSLDNIREISANPLVHHPCPQRR